MPAPKGRPSIAKGLAAEGFRVGERAEPTDAEAIAELTRELPLSRYCVIGGRVRSWVKFRELRGGTWMPLALIIEDNLLARVAVGALLRAGVRFFRSVEEAATWARTQSWPK